jgi:hypothetical protein
MSQENIPSGEDNSKLKLWFKRLGFAGFLFFLIKGLIWLAVIFGLGKYFS